MFETIIVYRSRKILDDFREAYGWLSQNTAEDARVMSWWDYGYQVRYLFISWVQLYIIYDIIT